MNGKTGIESTSCFSMIYALLFISSPIISLFCDMANLHIIPFIQSLSETEIKVADDHLQKSQPLFSDDTNKESKEYLLFKYIISNRQKTITDNDILSHIQIKDLTHLKVHLYNKVLESLTFDKYITNTDIFTPYDSTFFVLKKKLLAFRTQIRVANKGKTEALNELLEQVIHTAKEFELYEILIEALLFKKYFYSLRLGSEEFDKINGEISFYNYCFNASIRTNDSYYQLILNKDFIKALSEKELDKHLRSSIKQMANDYKKTGSQQINYYLHIMQFAYFERERKYKKAIEYCNKLITLLKQSKVVFRSERMGFALDNLSQLKTYIGQYENAAKDARSAQSYYPENSLSYIISKEQEFHAYFYDSEFDKAEKCVNILLAHSSE